MAVHCQAMLDLQKMGAHTFDFGNNLRGQAKENGGVENDFDFPGFVPAYLRPLFFEGKGPFRWVALSGDPEDIFTTDRALLDLFPEDVALRRWLTLAGERIQFQGLPARICWLGYGEREKAGLLFNDLVRTGKVSAPIVIGRDHLDCGSVASPNRETEAMKDGSDAVADWPILNALVNAVNGGDMACFLADVIGGKTLAEGEPLWWRDARHELPQERLERWENKQSSEVATSRANMDQISYIPWQPPK